MNINNLTQLEIEQAFSNEKAREMLRLEYNLFYQAMSDEHVNPMYQVLKTQDDSVVNDMFQYILNIIGNKDVGTPVTAGNYQVRDISVYNIIQGIANSPTLESITKSNTHKYNLAMDIVAEFDTILWDLHKEASKDDDGEWTTRTFARVEVLFSEDSQLISKYKTFRLPMVESPDNWQVGYRGGYQLNKRKVTTNRGEADQPQNVLDVLNKLQKQAFMLSVHCDIDSERQAFYDKMLAKTDDEWKSIEAMRGALGNTHHAYEALSNKSFYWEWRYDFRGRAYNTGYDITLQGDKHKKGSIVHTF